VGLDVFAATFAGCWVVGAFVFAWGFLSQPPNGPGEFGSVLPPLCVISVFTCLLGQARIVVDGAGLVDVIGPVLTRRVPVADVAAIETDAGVALRLVSGRRIGTVAYQLGRGSWPHHPFFEKAARRLESVVQGLPRSGASAGSADGVETRLNGGALVAVIGLCLLLVAGTLGINVWLSSPGGR
jgi:hypothetical protein